MFRMPRVSIQLRRSKRFRDIMNNPKAPAAARISAACALLDRGYGKPSQAVDATTNVHYFVSDQPMTEEEWAERCVTEH